MSAARTLEVARARPGTLHPIELRPARHRRLAGGAFAALVGLGLALSVGTVLSDESRRSLRAPGGVLTAVGDLAGLTGAYLLLVMVLLIARLPWVERAIGQDRLVRWHRRLGPWVLGLVTLHVVSITLGYAEAARSGPLRQLWVFLSSYPDLLAAAVAFLLLVMVGVSSVRAARRRLRYETWWVVHLYAYLALALAFAHEIVTGSSFVGHPLTRAVWIAVWAATAGLVLAFRFGLPLLRSLRHRLRIVEVRVEAPGVFSVTCAGRHLDRLPVSGGQFFQWRFLARGLWWQAHPFSLSALPRADRLRVTVKAVGDQSSAIARLAPGTKVAIEGPYGTFTPRFRASDKVALVGGGVGITPLRALLEDLPEGVDVALVVRASSREALVHHDEIAALVAARGGRLHEIVGPRTSASTDASALTRLVPDLAERDLYVCGSPAFSAAVMAAARELGVPRRRIHDEVFAF